MYKKPEMVGPLNISDGAVRSAKRQTYDKGSTGKMQEALVFIVFPEREAGQDCLVASLHNLGRVPQMWSVVGSGLDSDAGATTGQIAVATTALSPVMTAYVGTKFTGIYKGDLINDANSPPYVEEGTYVLDINAQNSEIVMSRPALRTSPAYPSSILVTFSQSGARAPGIVYTDNPAPFTENTVAFRCTVPYTWAKIALR